MEEIFKIEKVSDIMASFDHYMKEKNRKDLEKLEESFWKDTPEMYQKYLKLVDEIEVQKNDHESELYYLDVGKLDKGEEGSGSLRKRQKELRKEHQQYIKDLFLFNAKDGEKEGAAIPANKENDEGLKLVLDKKLYKKYQTYEKRVSSKKAQFKKAIGIFSVKKNYFENFLKDRYPKVAKICKEEDIASMLGMYGKVEKMKMKYDLSALTKRPFKKGPLNDPSLNIPKDFVKNIAADINKNRTIGKRLKK